jgi:hypothetical protein
MGTVIVLFGVFALLALLSAKDDRPTELSADVWVPDAGERAARLKAAVAAWREGRKWTPPEKLMAAPVSQWRSEPAETAARQEGTERRLVRCCPMHKPRWR